MTIRYSVEVCRELEQVFREAALCRPMQVGLYRSGLELEYDVTGAGEPNKGHVRLIVEDFVGGGFAGQVYRVKVMDIEPASGVKLGLETGGVYAMKVFIPPTAFSRLFRNALYWLGFQGPFQLQVNPAAVRASALWQKFIRRGVKIRFGDERAVADVHATLVDTRLGSCGELSEWIEGRTWRLEVDDRLDLLKRWIRGKEVDVETLGSPEYRAKREFMDRLVELMHDMGAHELARQYEWSTWKSQPNCLKRKDTEELPSGGLVAVDFQAGLALLPFLPMNPGDFKLIAQGLMRGSLVQFDRGDISKLEQFTEAHNNEFADMRRMLDELKAADRAYRDSIPDITHNHVRLLCGSGVWSTVLDSVMTGWKVRNLVDERGRKRLKDNRALTLVFLVIGVIPLIGRALRRIWGRQDWRKHYRQMLTSWMYLRRAVRGKTAEYLIGWHMAGRIDGKGALKTGRQIWPLLYHLPLSLLPTGLHRSIADWQYAKERLIHIAVRPFQLYFNAELREQWLREMVTEGKKKHLLTDEDAEVILSQVNEPFIQKYLKSLAVHVCTLPVTQIVSVLVAIIYVAMHPEMPRVQAWSIGLGIIALFQVVPISPGSMVRGLYVLYLVIRERNFKDYNIAVFLGFLKYIGYLAFPIQMAYHYPALARFMATHWATEAVHIVPVFGESGALLEHEVFCLFYNWPLTIRRRIWRRAQMRASLKSRYWHIVVCVIVGSGIFSLVDLTYLKNLGELPSLKEIWWIALLVPALCGAAVTLGAGGAALRNRIIGAAICGGVIGLLYTVMSAFVGPIEARAMATAGLWRVFLFTILSAVGVLLTEMKLPEPKAR
jgi:hypothetical protein